MRRCFYVKEKFAKMLARARRLFSTLRRWRITRGYHTGRPQALNVLRLEEVRLHGKKGEKVTHQGLHAPAAACGGDVARHHRFKYGKAKVVPRLEGERRQADETEK